LHSRIFILKLSYWLTHITNEIKTIYVKSPVISSSVVDS
jgi:hypothetical protein